jgi:hypothetical protein
LDTTNEFDRPEAEAVPVAVPDWTVKANETNAPIALAPVEPRLANGALASG